MEIANGWVSRGKKLLFFSSGSKKKCMKFKKYILKEITQRN